MIRATNLYERAYEHLKREIYEGRFPCDAPVLEADLAERLGVSRTPVREALRMLVSQGLLDPVSGGGYSAVRITARDVLDAVETRVAVETVAVRLAAERASDADLARIDDANRRARRALDVGLLGEAMEANESFHRGVAEAAGSRLLLYLLGRIYEYIRVHRVLDGVRAQRAALRAMETFVEEHETIADALRSRDAARAHTLMADHLSQLAKWYESSLALVRDEADEAAAGRRNPS